ncbi:MAG: tetratricopeptide repeat protein, partial [Verrucomicrobia bacterium]|nr:tetratricopeptide repeat protein [Verrucomicrobiota bacterium]
MKVVNIFVVAVVLFVGFDLHAQDQAPSVSSKTLKYHKVLVKRPNSGYLYDRFYGSWLEGSTVESLQAFLLAKAQADTATTGDHLLLAFFYAKQGEDGKALEVFEKALRQDGSNAEAWLEKAKAEARTLDYETALADLAKALAAGPKAELEVRIKKLKGRLLAKDGKNEQALKVWQELMAGNADAAELREDVIELLSDEGLYDEAIVVAKELSETTRDPYQKIQRKLLTGDLQQRAGSREEALATYGESLAQTGHGTWIEREILSQIDRMFRSEDDIEGLQAFFSELLKKEGKRIALRQRRAGLLGEMGDEKAAIEAWREILELTPGDLPVREAFIAALAQMKRDEEAVKQMQALLKISSDDPERLLRLAQLQWAAEDAESAEKSVARYLEQSQRDEYAYLRAARLLQTFRLEQETLAV